MLSVDAIDLYYGASQALRRVSLTAKKGELHPWPQRRR
jgi:ABC-type branched-subunit amino acid transport system ATPase component